MSNQKSRQILFLIFSFIILLSLTGCISSTIGQTKPKTIPSQEGIGSSHVTVLSVIPWDEIKEDLQPHFDNASMADKILTEAIPITAYYDEQILDKLLARLDIALPTTITTSSSSETTVVNNDGNTTKNKTTSSLVENKSGTLPTNTSPSDAKSATPTIITGRDTSKSHHSINPMMNYLAATALFQEIHLIEHYIDKNIINVDEYDPYVVRLQVTVMPSQKDLPYDTYVNMSFYPKQNIDSQDTASSSKFVYKPNSITIINGDSEIEQRNPYITLIDDGQKIIPVIDNIYLSASSSASLSCTIASTTITFRNSSESIHFPSLVQWKNKIQAASLSVTIDNQTYKDNIHYTFLSNNTVRIIPLLVTDNLEAADTATGNDKIRQTELTLAGMISGVGGNSHVQSLNEASQTSSYNKFNSLLTLGSISENTIRVRLGAIYQGKEGYSMVPRTHNISVLLLVPKNNNVDNIAKLNLISYVTYMHAEDGSSPEPIAHDKLAKKLEKFFSSRGLFKKSTTDEEKNAITNGIVLSLIGNNYPQFVRVIKKNPEYNNDMINIMWTDLLSMVRVNSKHQVTTFDIKPHNVQVNGTLPSASQTVIVQDNASTTTIAILKGGDDLRSFKKMTVFLEIMKSSNDRKDKTSQEVVYSIPADDIRISEDGKKATLSFPSLIENGFVNKNDPSIEKKLRIRIESQNDKKEDKNEIYIQIKYKKPIEKIIPRKDDDDDDD